MGQIVFEGAVAFFAVIGFLTVMSWVGDWLVNKFG